jgi:hypothetical protein
MQFGNSLPDTYNIHLAPPSSCHYQSLKYSQIIINPSNILRSLSIPQIFSDHYLPSECFAFDIAVNTSATNGKAFCPYYLPLINYLNQEALGVPLNFTYISESVLSQGGEPPKGTGDAFRTSKSNIDCPRRRGLAWFSVVSRRLRSGLPGWCRHRVGRRVRETSLCQRWPTWATPHPFKS